MLISKPLNKLLFIDLETAPQYKSFYLMPFILQELFLKKFKKEAEEMIGLPMDLWKLEEMNTPEWQPKIELFYNNRAPICGEFLKIICISIGWIDDKDIPEDEKQLPVTKELNFKYRNFAGHDETKILKDFYEATKSILDKILNPSHHLVAYNGLGYDFPVLMKRFLINKLPLPAMLDTDGRAPWTLNYMVDPKKSWQGTDFGGAASLALLCEVLGVPSPKSDIDGSQIRNVYYNEGDVDRIARYCCQDIYRLCEVYLRMKGLPNNLILVN